VRRSALPYRSQSCPAVASQSAGTGTGAVSCSWQRHSRIHAERRTERGVRRNGDSRLAGRDRRRRRSCCRFSDIPGFHDRYVDGRRRAGCARSAEWQQGVLPCRRHRRDRSPERGIGLRCDSATVRLFPRRKRRRRGRTVRGDAALRPIARRPDHGLPRRTGVPAPGDVVHHAHTRTRWCGGGTRDGGHPGYVRCSRYPGRRVSRRRPIGPGHRIPSPIPCRRSNHRHRSESVLMAYSPAGIVYSSTANRALHDI